MKITLDREPEEVKDLVLFYTCNRFGASGQLEDVTTQLKETREVLARLINVLGNKGLLSENDLIETIRGY